MDPDEAQALVARCLADPPFLVRMIDTAITPEHECFDDSFSTLALTTEQCKQLEKVQGFITKVKHNALRRLLPCTFRLLSVTGLELQFFVSFAARYMEARLSGPLRTTQHFGLLTSALQTFLERVPVEKGAPILDMLSHERLLYELRVKTTSPDTPNVIIPNPHCRVAYYSFDVVPIAADLTRAPLATSPQLEERKHFLLYQADLAAGVVRVREINALMAAIFGQLFTAKTFSAVAQNLSTSIGIAVTEAQISKFVDDSIEAGIISSVDAAVFRRPR
ncbi:hypothetical protein PQQ72_24065 [Paraburkholderia strydomiana]|uniref:hypothetical protein n=1 Tax=Paraburkholderia strydomiana TaxID=1245417 RepID=UPI0038BAD258